MIVPKMLRYIHLLHYPLLCVHIGPTSLRGTGTQDQTTTASTPSSKMSLTAAEAFKLVAEWVSKLKTDCPEFRLLVIGMTGVGKSTLINNLLGEDVAGMGYSITSATSAVSCYKGTIEGVPVKVYDTPGLADSRSERDEEYLAEIKKLTDEETIHLIIYCLKMTENKIHRGIIRTFQQYNRIGVDWKKTAIALTFADVLKPSSRERRQGISKKAFFEQRLAEWRLEIPRVLAELIQPEEFDVTQIKINPTTDDYEELLPNDEQWYIPFWLDVLEVLPPAARIRFVDIHKANIIYGDNETREPLPDDIHLSPPSHHPQESFRQHPDDETHPPPPKLARKSFKGGDDYTLPPLPPQSHPSHSPPFQPTPPEETNVAPRESVAVNISISNQAPVTHNPSTLPLESAGDADNGRVKRPVIKLEGERRERFESTLGDAVQLSAGIAAGGMVGAAAATIGAVVLGAVAAPVVAAGAAVGVLGAGVAKLFRLW